MSTTTNPVTGQPESDDRAVRIGEVAELTGTTPRTIRYYEEIGLLAGGTEREIGKHRCYSQADIDRINEIVRLKELLGLSLEQLSQLLEAETARADIRREFRETDDPDRQHQLLLRSSGHIDTQLSLVRGRLEQLTRLEQDLSQRAELVREKLAALEGVPLV
jgi:DNA-binding transcriptional MerR regulator